MLEKYANKLDNHGNNYTNEIASNVVNILILHRLKYYFKHK